MSQEASLFNDSVMSNVTYGSGGVAVVEQVSAASDAAFACEFIQKLPEGYESLVGE